jgi:hypothetical protein
MIEAVIVIILGVILLFGLAAYVLFGIWSASGEATHVFQEPLVIKSTSARLEIAVEAIKDIGVRLDALESMIAERPPMREFINASERPDD